jgi:hypothetical protein
MYKILCDLCLALAFDTVRAEERAKLKQKAREAEERASGATVRAASSGKSSVDEVRHGQALLRLRFENHR